MQVSADDRRIFERTFCDALVRTGRLDAQGLERAIRIQSSMAGGLIELLSGLGIMSERDLADAMAQHLGLSLVAPYQYPDLPILEDKISVRFLRDARVLPLSIDADSVSLAMADPFNRFAIDTVGVICGRRVKPSVAPPAELEAAIERLYGCDQSISADLAEAAARTDDDTLDVDRLKDLASEAPVIRLVNKLIFRAIDQRASDIHIAPSEGRLRVRYRIDGVLREVAPPPPQLRAAIVSRIKIMARLNIAERRLPQDGRVMISVHGIPIDLRVATVPTLHGESMVMRLLNRDAVQLDFLALGIVGRDFEAFAKLLDRPNGIVLVTGPTGSGKTTTLYASLVRLSTPACKILSVEDPIEYQLDGIDQIQVKPSIGLDFATILRSLLRHDPDIMMVGEIRDLDTAEIAVQAALTGHLVLSTLHTNNAASSITRLLDMGVRDFLLTSTVNGVAAQRLVRTLCRHCRKPFRPVPELLERLGLGRFVGTADVTLYSAAGCAECGGTGYYGRTTVFEVLTVDDSIRRLILRHAEANEIQRLAIEQGMRTMYEDGMMKAMAGETTIEEVLKVTRDV